MTHVKLEKSQGLDLSKIDSCIGDPEEDVENPILKLEQDAQIGKGSRGDVTILPTLIINQRQYRGKLDKGAVLKAICSGFEETTEPAVCLTDEIETNECLENNGGCRQNKAANITACKAFWRTPQKPFQQRFYMVKPCSKEMKCDVQVSSYAIRDAEEYKNFCDRPNDQRPHAEEVIGDIAEHLTTIYLSRCERGKRCLYEGSTPPGGYPSSWNGATHCTSELAVLKNSELHTWDKGYDDEGNQVRFICWIWLLLLHFQTLIKQ